MTKGEAFGALFVVSLAASAGSQAYMSKYEESRYPWSSTHTRRGFFDYQSAHAGGWMDHCPDNQTIKGYLLFFSLQLFSS
jgi:hypothetical protein